MARIAKGSAELGMTTTTVLPMARTGKAPFKKPIHNVRAIVVLFPSHQHIAATRRSSVKSIRDIKDKKFNCMASVTSMEFSRVHENLEALDLLRRTTTRLAAERRTEANLGEMERHCEAFETATDRRDPSAMIETNWDFDAVIGAVGRNGYIEKTYRQVLIDGLRIARLAMAYECYGSEAAYHRHIKAILGEHRQMVDFIRQGSADQAEAVAASHAGLARTRVTDYFRLTGTAEIAVDESDGLRRGGGG